MENSMRVKILKAFKNPMTNRVFKLGEEINVSKNIFWLRRLESKDCEKTILKKAKPLTKTKDSKKGSK